MSRATRCDLDFNPAQRDLAEHYGVAVLTARARRPKRGVLLHRGIARTVQKGLCLGCAVLDVFFGGELNGTEA
jgi:hypothetical protein